MRAFPRVVLAAAILASSFGCASVWARHKRDDVSKIGKRNVARKSMISLKKEREIGRKAAVEYVSKRTVVSDPAVVSYLDRVVQNVVLNSDLKTPLLVKVVSSPGPGFTILPGGFLYINSGEIEDLDDEGQLAAIIAFAAADTATRHWASRETKATILQYAVVPLIHTPMTYGTYQQTMRSYADDVSLAFLRFRRHDVAESDHFAVQYLYKAGYDPNSYVSLLEKSAKIEDAQTNKPPEKLRDRPPARARIASCQKEIKRILPARAPTRTDNSDFLRIRAILQAVAEGEQAR